MVNWSSPDIVKWKEETIDTQQELFEKLGDRIWDYFKEDERWGLEKKVAFALFGEPTCEPTEENSIGYSSEIMTEIKRICNLIYEQSGKADVCIAFLFIIGKIYKDKYCIPVIKVQTDEKEIFLDSLGRKYMDWSDFKSNNKLPKSLVCYPLNGTYQADKENKVLLEFSTSASCSLGSKVGNTLDTITTGVGLGATAIGIAGLFVTVVPPLAIASTVGLAASGAYGLIRGSFHLHDRRTHNQTISLTNSEARNCWLSILGGAFGFGSALAVSKAASIAAQGRLLGRTSQFIVNFFNFGALTVNGVGIINGLAHLVEKKQKRELTKLDVFQWTASVFFFYNAALNIKTANGIIKDVQEGIKNDFSNNLSNRRMKGYKRFIRETTADTGTIEGNARLIKGISNIGSKDEFFRLMLKGQKKFDKSIKFNEQGHLVARGQRFFDTKAGVNYPINYKVDGNFFKLPGEDLKCIYKCKETLKLMEVVSLEIKKSYIVIDENVKFELNTGLLRRLSQVLLRYCDPEQDEGKKKEEIYNMISQTEKFAQDKGCSSEETLVSYYNFICIYKKSKLRNMEVRYEKEKSELMSIVGDEFDEAEFDKNWGIQDSSSKEEAFRNLIDQEINKSNKDLKKEFDRYNSNVEILNESGNVKFHTNVEALIHFYHCFVTDIDERLTPQEYFETIRKTVDESLQVRLTEWEGDKRHALYYDESVPVVVEVEETKEGVFFQSTVFQVLDEPEEK